jgi:hypothetical protein
VGALDANGDYVVKCIHKMQNDQLKSFCPRQDVSDEYNEHTQKWAKKVVFGQNCRTWYDNHAVCSFSIHDLEALLLIDIVHHRYKDPKTGHLR